MNVEVVLSPPEIALLPARDLSGTVCVVFDVLRASSTMLAAFANGARRIYPVATVEEARLLQREKLPDALLAGERRGLRIVGFDLGNSPLEYRREIVEGCDIVTTTTNGTLALRACDRAKEVVVGAWVNTDALVAYLLAHAEETPTALLVCAGTGANFALEDGLAAGAVCACLARAGDVSHFNDAASATVSLYRRWSDDPLTALRGSENGKRLIQLGLEQDVEWCAQTDASDWIACRRLGAFEGQCIAPGFKPYGEIFQRLRELG